MKISKINIPQIKETAYDVYRYACNRDCRMIDKLINFYKEGVKNPTVAKLIAEKTRKDGIKRYSEYLVDDIFFLRGKPIELIKEYNEKLRNADLAIIVNRESYPVLKFYERFNEKFKKLYPQTHMIREQLIQDQRVCFDEIKPCMPKGIKKAIKYSRYF